MEERTYTMRIRIKSWDSVLFFCALIYLTFIFVALAVFLVTGSTIMVNISIGIATFSVIVGFIYLMYQIFNDAFTIER